MAIDFYQFNIILSSLSGIMSESGDWNNQRHALQESFIWAQIYQVERDNENISKHPQRPRLFCRILELGWVFRIMWFNTFI